MRRRLSKRLQAVADFVPAGCRLADIGTDHALLPVALLEEDLITHAIAMDVGEGPLERARQTVSGAEQKVRDRIETRLSDGFAALHDDEADCAVIAGMGGALTIQILKAADLKTLGITTLILEPQSEAEEVRRYLREARMYITDEAFVEDGGKFYPVLRVQTEAETDVYLHAARVLTEAGMKEERAMRILYRYGPLLVTGRDPVLRTYLERERARMEKALRNIEESAERESGHIRGLRTEHEDAVTAWEYTGGADAVS